jgi:DNA-binding transcriptional LysR family regulator
MVDLVEDEFDVVFRIGTLADSSLIARALAPFRVIACANPGYLERHGEPDEPADLPTPPKVPSVTMTVFTSI